MRNLGKILKKQRENMGISLWDAQEGTKIAKRYLCCMEEGDFDAIPGGRFYLHSFLKNYAHYIGLDGPAVVKYYQELAGEEIRCEGGSKRQSLLPQRNGIFKAIYRTLVSFM